MANGVMIVLLGRHGRLPTGDRNAARAALLGRLVTATVRGLQRPPRCRLAPVACRHLVPLGRGRFQ